MSRSSLLAVAALVAGAIALSPGTSLATTITQTASQTDTAVPFSTPFTFGGFDTSLGTLNAITLTLTLDETASSTISNTLLTDEGFTSASASFLLGASVSAPGSSVTSTSLLVTAGPFAGTVLAGTTLTDAGSLDTSTITVSIPIADFSDYEGASVIVTAILSGGAGIFSGSSVQGVQFGGTLDGSTTATLVYDYSANSRTVPEPLTLSLIGTGLLLGAAVRRRRVL